MASVISRFDLPIPSSLRAYRMGLWGMWLVARNCETADSTEIRLSEKALDRGANIRMVREISASQQRLRILPAEQRSYDLRRDDSPHATSKSSMQHFLDGL